MKSLYIVGLGPGNLDYTTQAALDAISHCDVLVGGRRNLDSLKHFCKGKLVIDSDLDELFQRIAKIKREKDVCIVVSGDPGFYSLLGYIKRRFPKEEFTVIPGISSFQYLFCKLGRQWKDYSLFSLHGINDDLENRLEECMKEERSVIFLTDKFSSPDKIAQCLIKMGYEKCNMIVGENLSYKDERILSGNPKDIGLMKFGDLNVVVIDKYGM